MKGNWTLIVVRGAHLLIPRTITFGLWRLVPVPVEVIVVDDAEDITNKLHSPYALLLTPTQREKRIFTECTGVVPAKYPPKIKSELFSLL